MGMQEKTKSWMISVAGLIMISFQLAGSNFFILASCDRLLKLISGRVMF